jgi:hypothetical protein
VPRIIEQNEQILTRLTALTAEKTVSQEDPERSAAPEQAARSATS